MSALSRWIEPGVGRNQPDDHEGRGLAGSVGSCRPTASPVERDRHIPHHRPLAVGFADPDAISRRRPAALSMARGFPHGASGRIVAGPLGGLTALVGGALGGPELPASGVLRIVIGCSAFGLVALRMISRRPICGDVARRGFA